MSETAEDRIGTSPECATCRHIMAPLGRSVPLPLAGSMCNDDCPGYMDDPKPDQLWPGETAEEFGYILPKPRGEGDHE